MVVRNNRSVSELEFHDAMIAGLARAARKLGRGALADAMEMTGRGLDKVFAGSNPHPKRLWDAHKADESVMDEIADLYDCKVVPKSAVVAMDQKAAPCVVALLHKMVTAEADGAIDHKELLDMEDDLRKVSHCADALLSKIDALRKPRAVQS